MFYYFTVPFLDKFLNFALRTRATTIYNRDAKWRPYIFICTGATLLFDQRERLQHAPTLRDADDIVARTVAL